MTPADPSLLAQLRQLREDIHRWRVDIDQREAIDVICEWGDRMDAILKSTPPETPPTDELARLRAENARLRVPPPGWHRMAVVRATPPGEPLDPGYYVWVRTPEPAPETEPMPNAVVKRQTLDAVIAEIHRCAQVEDLNCWMVSPSNLIKRVEALYDYVAPTPDPPAEAPRKLSADAFGLSENLIVTPMSASEPADTPTGLAPLDNLEHLVPVLSRGVWLCQHCGQTAGRQSAIDHPMCPAYLALRERQASASARREAIEFCLARLSDEAAYRGIEDKKVDEIIHAISDRYLAENQPSVSPRPPSGGGQ